MTPIVCHNDESARGGHVRNTGKGITVKINRRSTASDLSRQLSSTTGTTVSRQTVYIRLVKIGLYARRPVRCVPFAAIHTVAYG
ncbi:hypothetical protein TNCV_2028541 [Trichonephila clavipes]|nr:hypothetical protein TNCV_2028541 [Trichonephila clavipes]